MGSQLLVGWRSLEFSPQRLNGFLHQTSALPGAPGEPIVRTQVVDDLAAYPQGGIGAELGAV